VKQKISSEAKTVEQSGNRGSGFEVVTIIIHNCMKPMKPLLYLSVLVGLSAASLTLHLNAANSAQTSPPATRSEEFRVVGTEPFWGISVGKRGIVYSTTDSKPRSFPYSAPMTAQGRPADLVRVYRLQSKPNTNNVLVIKKVAACSDSMSDKQYPYSATLILDNAVREGCAERK
jgi:uncharacterized membrane protein